MDEKALFVIFFFLLVAVYGIVDVMGAGKGTLTVGLPSLRTWKVVSKGSLSPTSNMYRVEGEGLDVTSSSINNLPTIATSILPPH